MFAKIFRQIFESSIAEHPSVRFTFMDLLVLADPNGVVDMTHESISRITNRPLDEIRSTIAALEGPDPRSRTPDEDGARLRRLDDHRDWGWIIVNYDRFREIASEEQRRERTRERVNRLRARRKEACNAPVTHGNAGNAMQRQKQRHKQKKGGEEIPPEYNIDFSRTLSDSERITLEQERKRLVARREILRKDDFKTELERHELRGINDRISKIDAATHIKL